MDTTIPRSQPLVSVVMCAYNARPFIEAAVNSILGQTYKNLELIISDDGSNDGTREWLRGLEGKERVRLYFQERNLGYVGNKNFVHQQARGEYITQQDNDDISSLDRLEKQVAEVMKHPEIKLVACGYNRIDEQGKVYGTVSSGKDILLKREDIKDEYPLWFPSLLVHRSVFDEIGLFDPFFAGVLGDDLYWTIKANELYPIYCLAKPMYGYRNNPRSITNVLSNERKMIMPKVIDELASQRQQNGTDWLEQKQMKKIAQYESILLQDKRFMAEHYRIWAAKAIDKGNFEQAGRLMKKAFALWPFNLDLPKTFIYYLRKRSVSVNSQ